MVILTGCGDSRTVFVTNEIEGTAGPSGTDGAGCNVYTIDQGTLVECGNNSVVIPNPVNGLNGTDGRDGIDGQDGEDAEVPPYAVVSIIDPCGDAPDIYDEVLLKLANGQFLASFSDNANGKNTRFALVPVGTYQTTDGSNCTFTINADGSVS